MKHVMTSADVEMVNQGRVGDEDIKIIAADLSRTLAAKDLMLVGDGERFKVVEKE
jgi:hypothetical protein